jgi:ubiquitin-like-conjugating enzyme ATG10
MLSEFPHLTTPEFQDACNYLVTVFRQHGDEQKHWQAVESVPSVDHPYLNITKELQTQTNVYEKSEYDAFEHHDMKEEDDDEALQIAQAPPAYVHYDILLSPIYRVPVLYVSISDSQHRYPPTMDVLYEHLIPPQFKAQAESGGVIGGISITVRRLSNSHTLETK